MYDDEYDIDYNEYERFTLDELIDRADQYDSEDMWGTVDDDDLFDEDDEGHLREYSEELEEFEELEDYLDALGDDDAYEEFDENEYK